MKIYKDVGRDDVVSHAVSRRLNSTEVDFLSVDQAFHDC